MFVATFSMAAMSARRAMYQLLYTSQEGCCGCCGCCGCWLESCVAVVVVAEDADKEDEDENWSLIVAITTELSWRSIRSGDGVVFLSLFVLLLPWLLLLVDELSAATGGGSAVSNSAA